MNSGYAASCCTAQWLVASGPSIQWLRSIMLHSAAATDRTVATEQARAAISSAQWLLRKLEHWFRPHGADRASSRRDFECTVVTERARAVISSAQWPRRHARAVNPSAQWPRRYTRAVISNAQWPQRHAGAVIPSAQGRQTLCMSVKPRIPTDRLRIGPIVLLNLVQIYL